MPFHRHINERREEIMLADTERAVPADQNKRAVEKIVAPKQIPSLPEGTVGDQVWTPQVMRIYQKD